MREDPALEIGADLSLDEASDGRALPSRTSQEGLELFTNDFVEKSPLGLVALVSDGASSPSGHESKGSPRHSRLHAEVTMTISRFRRNRSTARASDSFPFSQRLPNRGRRFTRTVEPYGVIVARRKMNKRSEFSKRHTPGLPRDQHQLLCDPERDQIRTDGSLMIMRCIIIRSYSSLADRSHSQPVGCSPSSVGNVLRSLSSLMFTMCTVRRGV